MAAQTGDETSMLELYRTALRLRRAHPALGDGSLTWLDAPTGVLTFRREPGFVVAVNLESTPYRLPDHTTLLLASGTVEGGLLAPDEAVWLGV
ncbi:DUF3459 domain-containing protein [Streptomyces olivochromogenes]|uniref:DUF3459 domain-containing protein n=1 Tax=Streptomyces olivochromogenes TaxID=1963 RepID=UPI001F447110|nr:DUF3459 domain-containing protein [Streptomyces olivochromogenes]